ncbi:uncharacterized protein LOC143276990 [Babylonia areolata]|uniref:uncharacterized protein LOC143276990 n=1 Tax=Babylonia areolata TaxID=304850 RepID=UPI003FD34A2E
MAAPNDQIFEDSNSEDEDQNIRPEIYFMMRPSVRGQRWPTSIGIIQLSLGIFTSFLGLLEVLIVPLIENHTSKAQFNRSTCFGAGLWGGLVMVLTGSTALRAAMSKRKTTVFRFYNLTVFALLFYIGVVVFLIVAYSVGWTTESAYPPHSRMHGVHSFVMVFMVLGLLFALTPVIQYYPVSCCGELFPASPGFSSCSCCFSCCQRCCPSWLLGKLWPTSGYSGIEDSSPPALLI